MDTALLLYASYYSLEHKLSYSFSRQITFNLMYFGNMEIINIWFYQKNSSFQLIFNQGCVFIYNRLAFIIIMSEKTWNLCCLSRWIFSTEYEQHISLTFNYFRNFVLLFFCLSFYTAL